MPYGLQSAVGWPARAMPYGLQSVAGWSAEAASYGFGRPWMAGGFGWPSAKAGGQVWPAIRVDGPSLVGRQGSSMAIQLRLASRILMKIVPWLLEFGTVSDFGR